MMRQLSAGDRVVITHETRGTSIGKIESLRAPEEGEFPDATRVAVITYHASHKNPLIFTAYEIAGTWWDAQGRSLTIRRFGMA